MDVEIIVVPYDSAHRGARMGAGPEALVHGGLPDRLVRAGHRVTCHTLEIPAGAWRAEIRTAFELASRIAQHVHSARASHRWPLVLAGNCNSAVGVVAGIGPGTAVLWCDAHGDFNTPETTTGGFLDGMALATITGRCWRTLASQVPGFVPVSEAAVWLLGARDLDTAESELLDRSAIHRVPADTLTPAFASEIRGALGPGAPLYLHLDLDVLDIAEGRANVYAGPGGASAAALAAFCRELAVPAAMTLSAYDPTCDTDGRVREAAIQAVEELLAPAAS